MTVMRAIGLMSGTSMDGIDVALLDTDGERIVVRGQSMSFPYDAAFRRRIEAALVDATLIKDRGERPGELGVLECDLTKRHALAVNEFLQRESIDPASVGVVGFHGQTVLHRPERSLTVQLGDGQRLADAIGIPVVYDLRANDMTYGGQGAPLVPVYHQALAANLPMDLRDRGPAVFVNIGGISNITFIDAGKALVAFDTGPGNALIDQWVQATAGIPYDDGGTIASEGAPDEGVLGDYLASHFFSKCGPKSLDRNDFTLDRVRGLETADGAATLSKLSALAILRAGSILPAPPASWIVCGGGRKNSAILKYLREGAGEAMLITAEDAGFDGDAIEAEAWAYLAVRSLKGLPLTFPTTTGCREAVTGGVLAKTRKLLPPKRP
jgi:anhydro-N-acetylmuramic acid kinase